MCESRACGQGDESCYTTIIEFERECVIKITQLLNKRTLDQFNPCHFTNSSFTDCLIAVYRGMRRILSFYKDNRPTVCQVSGTTFLSDIESSEP